MLKYMHTPLTIVPLITRYLESFEDVCNRSVVAGLKMPDYIVMGSLIIARFHSANPALRVSDEQPTWAIADSVLNPKPLKGALCA